MAEAEDVRVDENERKRKQSIPPDGYTCSLCGIPGHWIQQCETKDKKKKRTKKRRNSDREFIAGIEPSPQDIAHAREMQQIQPPLCYCGKASRIKKVKQSRVSRDSRAIGNYFFFCAERRDDQPKCRFARPAEEQLKLLSADAGSQSAKVESKPKTTKGRPCTFFSKKGSCKKGDACTFSHELSTNAALA